MDESLTPELDQDRLRKTDLAEVRRKIQTGIDELDRGEGIPGDEALATLRAKSVAFREASNR